MLLICGDESSLANSSEAEHHAMYLEYGALTEEMKKRGVYVDGRPLQPSSTATVVRVRGGKRATTDGPFAETKEQLGGFYLLNCKDLDEALEFAAKIPGARHGAIEVRPVMEIPSPVAS